MDILSQQLQPASFRGISCSVTAESIPQKGRKYAIHDYPNSGKRFAQDLGELPASFDVGAVIHGDKFLEDAEKFEKALLAKGPGRLVLPHLGALDVVALPYKVDYKHKSIGVIGFELKFTISNTDEVPAQAPSSIEDVYQASDEAKLDMQEKFADGYKVPSDKKSLLTSANDYRKSVVNTVGVYSSRINNVNSQIQKIVLDVESDLIVLVRDPQLLAEKLIYGNIELANGLFATLSVLFSDTGSNAAGALSMVGFGEDFVDNGTASGANKIPLWPFDTGDRNTRNNNRVLTVEAVRINALLLGYETAANFDYKTSDEITEATLALEQAYDAIMLSGDPTGFFSNDSDFKLLLDNVKSAAFDVLGQKSQQVFSVAEFKAAGTTSLFSLAYELYAEQFETAEDAEEATEALLELNPDQNPATVSGQLSIFEVL